MLSWGAFHLSELTGHTILVITRISLLIEISQIPNRVHEGNGVSTKLLEKTFFIVKVTGPAMVQPASSDFWKVPLVKKIVYVLFCVY